MQSFAPPYAADSFGLLRFGHMLFQKLTKSRNNVQATLRAHKLTRLLSHDNHDRRLRWTPPGLRSRGDQSMLLNLTYYTQRQPVASAAFDFFIVLSWTILAD